MRVIADPDRLYIVATQFLRSAQEWRRQAQRVQESVQGLTGANDWSGAGAEAYRQHGAKLYQHLLSVVSALERGSMALQTLVSQLKYAEQLRQEARRYDRPTLGRNGQQFEDQEEARYLRRRADELREQANRIAQQADVQVARLFDEIAASVSKMEFARRSSRGNQTQDPYEGLPEHWRQKLQRNPELYEDPDQTVYVPPSPEVLRRRTYEQEREQLVTALKGLIRRTETYDWWDEQTIRETVEGQFHSYWRYDELSNQELALILEQRGGFETLSAEMQQKIREGKLGDHPEDDPDYLRYVASNLVGPPGQEISGLNGAIGVGGAAMAGTMMGKGRAGKSAGGHVEIPQWPAKIEYGDHYTKADGKKALKPNVEYTTNEGYTYSTDDNGRITSAEATIQLGKANRNPYAQRKVGGEDRLPDDDGGHLIASIFKGSGEIDNLVPMNATLNRSEYKSLENTWRKALEQGQKVEVKIEPIYKGPSNRPAKFEIEYKIDGKKFEVNLTNYEGGK